MIVLYRSRGLFMTGDSVQTGHNVNTPPSQDLLLGENKSGIEFRCAFKDSTGNLMSQGVSDDEFSIQQWSQSTASTAITKTTFSS